MAVQRYYGLNERKAYFEMILSQVYGTVSPGGASAMLGVSRARVHELIEKGKLDAWYYYDHQGLKHPSFAEVSVLSIARQGIRTGRFTYEGNGIPIIPEELAIEVLDMCRREGVEYEPWGKKPAV